MIFYSDYCEIFCVFISSLVILFWTLVKMSKMFVEFWTQNNFYEYNFLVNSNNKKYIWRCIELLFIVICEKSLIFKSYFEILFLVSLKFLYLRKTDLQIRFFFYLKINNSSTRHRNLLVSLIGSLDLLRIYLNNNLEFKFWPNFWFISTT